MESSGPRHGCEIKPWSLRKSDLTTFSPFPTISGRKYILTKKFFAPPPPPPPLGHDERGDWGDEGGGWSDQVSCHFRSFPEAFFWWGGGHRGWGAEGAEGAEGTEEADQGEVSTIILRMLESSGFRKCNTLLVIQLFLRRLCLCHCLFFVIVFVFVFAFVFAFPIHFWIEIITSFQKIYGLGVWGK